MPSFAEQPETFFVRNMRVRREELGITQTDLANQMRERGFPFHQQTVQRIELDPEDAGEKTARPVRLGEAVAIAEILNTSVEALLRPSANYDLEKILQRAFGAIDTGAEAVARSAEALSKYADMIRHPGLLGRLDAGEASAAYSTLRSAQAELEALAMRIDELSIHALESITDAAHASEQGEDNGEHQAEA